MATPSQSLSQPLSHLQPHPQSLTALPLEIISTIIAYMNDTNTLSHLNRTCKLIHSLSLSALYNSFTHNNDSYKDPTTSLNRIISFIRTLTTRPDLAFLIQHLEFGWPPDLSSLSPSSPDLTVLATTLHSQNLTLPTGSTSTWHYDTPTTLLPFELIISLTPNITSLTLSINDEWCLDLIHQFSSLSTPIIYHHLTHLTITYIPISGDRHALSPSHWLPFLVLAPNISSFHIPNTDSFFSNITLPPLPHLKTLSFDETSCSELLITTLLTHSTSLQNFNLEWIGSNTYDEEDIEDFSILAIWNALSRAHTTLTSIKFNSIIDIPIGNISPSTISSLSSFTNLQILKTSGRMIDAFHQSFSLSFHMTTTTQNINTFTSQLLPSTIQQLTIYDPSPSQIPFFLGLAESKSRGCYDDLREVEIAESPIWDTGLELPEWITGKAWPGREKEVKRCFENAGIEFTISLNSNKFIPGVDSLKTYARMLAAEKRGWNEAWYR